MLKYKKIDKKKLIINVIIMMIMFGGTGFFVYKNYTLTSHKTYERQEEIFDLEDFSHLEPGIETETEVGEEDEVKVNGDILDIKIFDDPKFKALKDNTIEWEEVEAGRENPFEPY